jgi:RNA polymerase sigma-70 factor (ECF subfamily)
MVAAGRTWHYASHELHDRQRQRTEETTMKAAFDTRDLAEHTRYLQSYALRKVNDRDLAEDLVQDTLLAALNSGSQFEGRSSVRTWLTGILKHKIIDTFRERLRAPLSLDEMTESGDTYIDSSVAAQSDHFDFGGDPEKQLEYKRFWEAFQRELGRMPARSARAFVLSEFTDSNTDQVCKQLGISSGALWVMRCRTRNSLRSALAPAFNA